MAQYAKNTNVSSELSRLEIEKILVKYGAENSPMPQQRERRLLVLPCLNGK